MKSKVELEEFGVSIDRLRKTKADDLLVKVGRGFSASAELSNAIATAVGSVGEVRRLREMCSIAIRRVDITATEEKAASAIRVARCSNEIGIKMGKMRKAPGGQRTINASLLQKFADVLLTSGKIQIGWSVNRVRLNTSSDRCFRCQGFGHRAANCSGPDR